MKNQFAIIFIIACVFGFRIPASAQSCTAATCTAASTSESDVLAALPSSSNANATVVVDIPAGTAAWTSQLTYTVPAAVTNLTIQGATTVNCTGTHGTSTYACTENDQTTIEDSASTNFALWQINAGGGGAGSYVRVSGITLKGGTGAEKYNGFLVVYGPTHKLRIDHMHFNQTYISGGPGSWAGRLFGDIEGVADHNVYDNGNEYSIAQGFDASNNINDTIGQGDGPWSSPTGFGGESFFFIEDSIINGGLEGDCDTGGKFVSRYNSILNGGSGSSQIHNHGTNSESGRGRSCRAYEAYHDYFQGPSGTPDNAAVGSAGGASIVWGNTVASGYYNFSWIGTTRNDGSQTEVGNPNGWGYCGSSSIDASTGQPNGSTSNWDGNSTGATGWPCIDGLGRGQGQALNGQNFPNALNSVTGTIAYPNQMLEPLYYFANVLNGTNEMHLADISTQLNRDVYLDNPGFNGTTGTGYGPLANRPFSCTAGPGGAYGVSPTGSYGVAYFATDDNNGNGELYVCTSANTWTPVYQPYTYPHPLVSGTSNAATPPPPTGLVATAY